jgi:hypothetical protein
MLNVTSDTSSITFNGKGTVSDRDLALRICIAVTVVCEAKLGPTDQRIRKLYTVLLNSTDTCLKVL